MHRRKRKLSKRYIAIREELERCNAAINYYEGKRGLSNYEQCCLEVMHNRRRYLRTLLDDSRKPYGEKLTREQEKTIPKIPNIYGRKIQK